MSRPPITVAEWRKSRDEIVRVQLSSYLERDNIDVRAWFTPENGGDLRPGKTGITMSVRHLPALAGALATALAKARELGLLPEGEGGQ